MAKRRELTQSEIRAAFEPDAAARGYPPFMTTEQVAAMLSVSMSTLYQWMSQGRLDGAYCRRGKRAYFWRDRLIKVFFNGPDWS